MSSLSPSCPICLADSRPAFMAAEHRMYRCNSCGTAFVSPMPSSEELAKFYERFHLSDEAGGMYDVVEGRMQSDFPAKVARVIRATSDRPGRLLDVGCGKGYFVKNCVERGIDAEGIDLSDTGVLHAVRELGVKARAGDIAREKASLGLFDAVTFWATIEHVPNPR